jgi:hypothetical protein
VELSGLEPGSVIEVVGPTGMGQGGCAAAMMAVVSVTSAALTADAEVGAAPEAPLAAWVPGLIDDAPYAKALLTDRLSYRATQVYRVYVHDAMAVGLKVAQNAYGGAGAPMITLSVGGVTLQQCGGSAGFAGRPGRSGRCDAAYDCGNPASTLPGDGFTGYVTITVTSNVTSSAAPTTSGDAECPTDEFNGWLFAIPRNYTEAGAKAGEYNSTTAMRRMFPLSPSASVAFAAPMLTLVLPHPNSTVVARLNGTVSWPAPSIAGRQLLSLTSEAWPPVELLTVVGPNATLACVADHVLGVQRCNLPVPKGAQRVAVRVMQSDFRANQVTVSFVNSLGQPEGEATTCGGSQRGTNFYYDEEGLEGACEVFLTCVDVFLPEAAAAVVITADAEVESRGCEVALFAEAAFSLPTSMRRRRAEDVPVGSFLCPSDHAIVDRSVLCDGLGWDCPDGADERCSVFRFVARIAALGEVRPWLLPPALPAASAHECRSDAMLNSSTVAFLFDRGSGGRCYHMRNATVVLDMLAHQLGRWNSSTAQRPAWKSTSPSHGCERRRRRWVLAHPNCTAAITAWCPRHPAATACASAVSRGPVIGATR